MQCENFLGDSLFYLHIDTNLMLHLNKTMKMKNLMAIFVLLAAATLTTGAIAQDKSNKTMSMPQESKMDHPAICVLYPTQGNNVSGIVTFTKVSGGIKVVADLQGLTKGKHGIHIHECGDCSAPDGTSAGGHFNPKAMSHGSPMDAMRHEGDMGNIEADDSGKAHLEYVDNTLSFEGNASIIGRSVIIHKGEDDFKTQPTGNAGARVACGVIGIGK
jgi:Cu-Zn family superoxide dismutase